jgi:hypothetical protein
MTLQAITYAGRPVAAASARRFYLAEHIDQRAPEDPERVFVMWMCCCARDILTGDLPGPYTDSAARAYAVAALIPTGMRPIKRIPGQLLLWHDSLMRTRNSGRRRHALHGTAAPGSRRT